MGSHTVPGTQHLLGSQCRRHEHTCSTNEADNDERRAMGRDCGHRVCTSLHGSLRTQGRAKGGERGQCGHGRGATPPKHTRMLTGQRPAQRLGAAGGRTKDSMTSRATAVGCSERRWPPDYPPHSSRHQRTPRASAGESEPGQVLSAPTWPGPGLALHHGPLCRGGARREVLPPLSLYTTQPSCQDVSCGAGETEAQWAR